MRNDRELLIERVTSAHREREPDGTLRAHAAWFDLDAAGRAEAAQEAERQRFLEAALDPEGLSTTARAVLARIKAANGGAHGE
jgi:hypothetical protein